MPKVGLINTVVIALSVVIAGYLIGNIMTASAKYNRSVKVKGLAEREVNADLAIFPVEITLTGNNLKLLKAALDAQKKIVLKFFTKHGFTNKEISEGVINLRDVETNRYGDRRENYRYIATRNFTIRTGDIDKLKKALSEAMDLVSEGVVMRSKREWKPIAYSYTKLNEIKPEMIQEATKNARKVAEKFAIDSDSRLGKIKSASQGVFSIRDRDENTSEIKVVRVVSTIDYFIED